MNFDVRVEVRLRPGIADPAGATVERACEALGFGGVSGVGIGKMIRFALDAPSADEAETLVTQLCERFLTNPVIEDSFVEIRPAGEG